MTKIATLYPSIASYSSGDFDECIRLAPFDLARAERWSEDYGRIRFFQSAAFFHCNMYYDVISSAREVLEVDHLPSEYYSESCYNMGVIAINMGDSAFSRDCHARYSTFESSDSSLAETWSSLLDSIEGEETDLDLLIENVRRTAHRKTAHRVQFFIGLVMMTLKRYEDAACIVRESLPLDDLLGRNLLLAVFEHEISKNVQLAQEVMDHYIQLPLTPTEEMAAQYMRLRMMEIQGEPISQQLKLAARIVNESHRNFDPSAHLSIKYCADLLKRHESREALVVPSRFGLVGIAPVMGRLRDRITRFAISSSPVLIRGESGTGKELVARAIHTESDRSDAPFIVVNCPAIPEGVFESNLFGHLEGSYTGAHKTHRGLIEEAGNGTLFLDEVGDLPQGVQAKLLRFLETGEYAPLGDSKLRHSKVRVLAATHQELSDQSRFRKDLYHRLSRLDLHLPSLDERREDITYLARSRVQALNMQGDDSWKTIDRGAEAVLSEMSFSGNVRELFNLIDHAWHESIHQISESHVIQARGEAKVEVQSQPEAPVAAEFMPEKGNLEVGFTDVKMWNLDYNEPTSLKRLQERAACQMVRQTLDHFEGNVDQTADYLEVSRRSVYRYLERDRRVPFDEEIS